MPSEPPKCLPVTHGKEILLARSPWKRPGPQLGSGIKDVSPLCSFPLSFLLWQAVPFFANLITQPTPQSVWVQSPEERPIISVLFPCPMAWSTPLSHQGWGRWGLRAFSGPVGHLATMVSDTSVLCLSSHKKVQCEITLKLCKNPSKFFFQLIP